MQHAFVTVAIPFSRNRKDDVQKALDAINPDPAFRGSLDATSVIHFLSITIVDSEEVGLCHLFLEASADGTVATAIDALANAAGEHLTRALACAGLAVDGDVGRYLERYRLRVGQGWFDVSGVHFDGTPGLSVERIRREADLAREAAQFLLRAPRDSALAKLEHVRRKLWDGTDEPEDGYKWAFIPEPAPVLADMPSLRVAIPGTLVSLIGNLLWPFLLLPVTAFLVALTLSDFATACWVAALVMLAGLGLAIYAYRRLRIKEETDVPADRAPDADFVREMLRREDRPGHVQNHLAARSVMKPGRLRRFTLRLGLWTAGILARYFSCPGNLGPTGAIHFARWVLLPRTNSLVFMSNYDGAWQSYIEDFIERASQGVNGIWSNTEGFPRTSNLFFKGARDGDRLLRWTRRQQIASHVWYSAYPGLTRARICLNAAIRQGIALAKTDADAVDWLSCFGSAPPPPDAVESEQIPTFAYGGLAHLRYGWCLMLTLAADERGCREWLRAVSDQITYGDSRRKSSVAVLGLSRSGLEKLGVDDEAIATFPVAFQHGASDPVRARSLGDDPGTWDWGGEPRQPIDAVLAIYADDTAELDRLKAAAERTAARFGHQVSPQIQFGELPEKVNGKRPKPEEPFGFVDGISQPIIRGVRRASRPSDDIHLVEPGEFILGYKDNHGYLPPSPSVAAADDPGKLLPAHGSDPLRKRPSFSQVQPTGRHDLGRNGSFLVVRQLEQDTEAFDSFLDTAAGRLGVDKEYLGAKIVGRWKNGAPVVRHPTPPDGGLDDDNAFRFGTEDPTGLLCPFGAHIRRANPRESFNPGNPEQIRISNRHRIFRVSRTYVQPEGEKPGIVFMGLCADIERQFEFIQQTWLLGRSFHGLVDEADPIIGGDGGFTIPMAGGPTPLPGLSAFVRTLGGAYFFLPSRRTLNYLSQPGRAERSGRARRPGKPAHASP